MRLDRQPKGAMPIRSVGVGYTHVEPGQIYRRHGDAINPTNLHWVYFCTANSVMVNLSDGSVLSDHVARSSTWRKLPEAVLITNEPEPVET